MVANANNAHLRKRTRVEEPIDSETALRLMQDLARSHLDVSKQQIPHGYLPPAAQLTKGNPVRCFEFKPICSAAPWFRASVVRA